MKSEWEVQGKQSDDIDLCRWQERTLSWDCTGTHELKRPVYSDRRDTALTHFKKGNVIILSLSIILVAVNIILSLLLPNSNIIPCRSILMQLHDNNSRTSTSLPYNCIDKFFHQLLQLNTVVGFLSTILTLVTNFVYITCFFLVFFFSRLEFPNSQGARPG